MDLTDATPLHLNMPVTHMPLVTACTCHPLPAEFAVAIRSALLSPAPEVLGPGGSNGGDGRRGLIARLFSGVGVVAKSDINAEWEELSLKARHLGNHLHIRL